MLYIFNQNEELQAVLKEYTEASHTEQLNKDNFFEFWIPANHPDSQFIKEENFVAFKDEDGELRLFVIKELEEVHDDVLYKEVFCKAAWMDELEDEVLEENNAQDQTMEDALSQALQDTRWQVGEVAELGLNEVDFYFESVLSAINNILSTWGGEVKDRILISGNKITGRYIDILPRRGADTGKTLSISKDLQSIHRTVVSYPKTALYGRGKGEEGADGSEKRLTFEEVEWSTQKDDPVDKPFGQKWVGDPDALQKYGRENFTRHRFDFFDSSDEEDAEKLLMDTWNALQEKNQILVSYDLSAISLEKIAGLEHEKVRLGDTVFIIDREFVPEILVEGRVIELKRVRNEPERTEIKLGNFLPLYTDDTRLDDVVDTINNNSGKWSSVDDSNFPNIEPPVPTNVQASGAFRSIIVEWDFDRATYIANYEVFASEVKGFTPDTSNLVFRGKTSVYSYEADVNEQWYFRVRAVNTHGTPNEFSEEVSATTARIISDDILFGEEIAAELRELSKKAEILAGDSIGIDKLKQEALDVINETAKQYTDEEIRETEEEIHEELAKKAGLNYVEGEFTLVDSDLADLLDEMEDLQEYASSIDQKADSISLDVSAIAKTVDDNTESILIVGSSITQLSDSIHLKVEETQAHVDTIDEDVTRVSSQMSELSVDVDGISTSVKSLESDFGDLGTRVSSSETSITQLSGSIDLTAKELDIVEGRMTEAEASLSVHADRIESKVERDGIISSINQSAESVQIKAEMIELDGDVYMTDGKVRIRDGAIGSAAIDNAAITRAHLKDAIIGTAQIENSAITNAKIADLAVDSAKISSLDAVKINAGTITGVEIRTANSVSHLYMRNQTIDFISNNTTKMRLGFYDSNNSLTTEPYIIMGLGDQIGRDKIYIEKKVGYFNMIYKPTESGESHLKMSAEGNVSLLAKRAIWFNADELITMKTLKDHRGSEYYINGSGDVTTALNRKPLLAGGLRTTGTNLYLATGYVQSGEVRVTDANGYADGRMVYRPIRASSFPTGSMASFKQNISIWDESALDLITNSTIYQYRLKDEAMNGVDRFRQGLVIGDGYNTPSGVIDGDGVEQYLMNSWSWKAIQELNDKTVSILDEINWMKMENQLLKARVKLLENAN